MSRLLVLLLIHICTTAQLFLKRLVLKCVKRFSGLSIASKKVQSVIIWGFVGFGNKPKKTTYLPANFVGELTILSEKYGKK